jgi:hypothetical protein
LGFWRTEEQLTEANCLMLAGPFSEEEVGRAILEMKVDSAPCPNGFTITFFRKLWKYINKEIMRMVRDFNHNKVDLKRLNYGVITLVPKIQEANTIKQYMSIYLLNVDFKIFAKLLTDRITPIAEKVVSESQTTFIKERNILEGVVILHEVLHEFRRSGKQGCFSRLILKRLTTRLDGTLFKKS